MLTIAAIDYTVNIVTVLGTGIMAFLGVKIALVRLESATKVNADHIAENKENIKEGDKTVQKLRIDHTGLDTKCEQQSKSIFAGLKELGEDIKKTHE